MLSALIVRSSSWHDVAPIVSADAFAGQAERAVADAVWACRRAGDDIDYVTLGREISRAGTSSVVGSLVSELADAVVVEPVRHARRVRDLAAARRTWELLGDMTTEVTRAEDDPLSWIDDVARRVSAAADVRRDLELQHVGELVPGHVAELKRRAEGTTRGLPTGIDALDAMTGGLHVGEYVVIAARPSCGKSALALQLATAVSSNARVALFSSEMTAAGVMDRLVSERGRVGLSRVRDGRLTELEMHGVLGAYGQLQSSHIWLSDRRGWRVNEIVAQVRQWKRQHAQGHNAVVLIDYLQLVRASQRHGTREQEVAEVSWALSTLAGEEKIALVVLAQLSREAEKRGADVPPQLSDLRESGSIEQDADGVWFLHRPDRIDPTIEQGAAILAIAKQRNGECGSINLWFQGSQQRFAYREREYVRRSNGDSSQLQAQSITRPGTPIPRRTHRGPSRATASD